MSTISLPHLSTHVTVNSNTHIHCTHMQLFDYSYTNTHWSGRRILWSVFSCHSGSYRAGDYIRRYVGDNQCSFGIHVFEKKERYARIAHVYDLACVCIEFLL